MKTETAVHPKDGRPLVHAETQEGWRAWLAENHDAVDRGLARLVEESHRKALGTPI